LYFFTPIRETKKGYKGVGMIRAIVFFLIELDEYCLNLHSTQRLIYIVPITTNYIKIAAVSDHL
jgi:hypothetical protein